MNTLDILDFTVYHDNILHKITAAPYLFPARNGVPLCFEITIDGKSIGDLHCHDNDQWENNAIEDKELVNIIGSTIFSKYNKNDEKIVQSTRI